MVYMSWNLNQEKLFNVSQIFIFIFLQAYKITKPQDLMMISKLYSSHSFDEGFPKYAQIFIDMF